MKTKTLGLTCPNCNKNYPEIENSKNTNDFYKVTSVDIQINGKWNRFKRGENFTCECGNEIEI